MKAPVVILLSLAGLGVLALAAVFTFHSWSMRDYNEAECIQPVVWRLAGEIRRLKDHRQPLPASSEALLSCLNADERGALQKCVIHWDPLTDPVLLIEVNESYGFTVDAGGVPQWLPMHLRSEALTKE